MNSMWVGRLFTAKAPSSREGREEAVGRVPQMGSLSAAYNRVMSECKRRMGTCFRGSRFMRQALIMLLPVVLMAGVVQGDPLRYEELPSTVTAYMHVDVDRVLNSQMLRQQPWRASSQAFFKPMSGVDVTLYSTDEGRPSKFVVLLHLSDAKRMDLIKAALSGAADKVVITYQNQEVYFSSANLCTALGFSPASFIGTRSKATTSPVPRRSTLQIGLGGGPNDVFPGVSPGASYAAIIGPDMVVAAIDLPAMATALDVLAGRRPSLAQEDTHHLKMEWPAGVICAGAGIQAELRGGDPTTEPTLTATNPRGNFKLDLIGSFEGKAELGRFDMGEDDQSVYIEGSCEMVDADLAQQLSSMILGMKALIVLSKPQHAELIAPLEAHAADKTVTVRWSWPVSKIADLYRISAEGNHDSTNPAAVPAAVPATDPARLNERMGAAAVRSIAVRPVGTVPHPPAGAMPRHARVCAAARVRGVFR